MANVNVKDKELLWDCTNCIKICIQHISIDFNVNVRRFSLV